MSWLIKILGCGNAQCPSCRFFVPVTLVLAVLAFIALAVTANQLAVPL